MSSATEAILVAAYTVILAGSVGYGLFRLISPRNQAANPLDLGRIWLAWTAMFASLGTLPPFFWRFDAISIVKWLIGLVVVGGLAFGFGWLYGRVFKFNAPGNGNSSRPGGLGLQATNGTKVRETAPSNSYPDRSQQSLSASWARGSMVRNSTRQMADDQLIDTIQWWYEIGGVKCGPCSAESLRELIAGGLIGPNNLLWQEGLDNWIQAGSTAEFAGAFAAEEPPPLPKKPFAIAPSAVGPWGAALGIGIAAALGFFIGTPATPTRSNEQFDLSKPPRQKTAQELVVAFAGQNVAGLGFDYPLTFQANSAKAQQWFSKVPANVKALTRSFELFEAPPANGLSDTSLVKARYVMTIQPNIDGAASESMQNMARLDGVKNFKQWTKSLSVSGHEARQSSFEAERYGAKFGGEFLIILDRRTNTMWQIQLLFGKKNWTNPFGSPNLDTERNFAMSLLRSVTVQEK